MTALYIICGIAAFLLLVLFSSARVKIKFDEDIRVKVGFWFLSFTVYPKKEKADKKKDQVLKYEFWGLLILRKFLRIFVKMQGLERWRPR